MNEGAMNPKHLTITILLVLMAGMALAQDVATADSVRSFAITEVSVTAPRVTTKDLLPAQTLSGEQLEQLSVHSVADARPWRRACL